MSAIDIRPATTRDERHEYEHQFGVSSPLRRQHSHHAMGDRRAAQSRSPVPTDTKWPTRLGHATSRAPTRTGGNRDPRHPYHRRCSPLLPHLLAVDVGDHALPELEVLVRLDGDLASETTRIGDRIRGPGFIQPSNARSDRGSTIPRCWISIAGNGVRTAASILL